eukprot:c55573_g1_i1 orf=185-421(-)
MKRGTVVWILFLGFAVGEILDGPCGNLFIIFYSRSVVGKSLLQAVDVASALWKLKATFLRRWLLQSRQPASFKKISRV